MSFTKLMSAVFGVIFIIILYAIIYYSLKIMYKDVKGGGRKKVSTGRRAHGLEVLESGENKSLKIGSIIPVRTTITLGRKEDNSIVLHDQFVSGYHAKLYVRNNEFFLEDLESTNGTFINKQRISGRVRLKIEDEIRLGSTIFKVID
ncbi:FHA domain-containing protein [Clostridium polyendosporum]|uniref:FHA domain-containing protein n=1 Tax=Clostridium polyendosporum TaxID=69208 RepID=A0A919RZ32_9CLOT|nr:FHA domain-containing protein [Clostridium polyendosporum]GIM28228.1 FHA domain-containing protein [Clostridium polyendosporum]